MTILATPAEMQEALARGRVPSCYPWYDAHTMVRYLSSEGFMRKVKCGKTARPWTFVNPGDRLDPTQVWVGFEVESGYNDADTYVAAMRHLEDSSYRVCVDNEGTGAFMAEITFEPVNLSDLRTSAGPEEIIRMSRTMRPARHHYDAMVGTHLNMSTPAMRQRSVVDNYYTLTAAIGGVMDGLSPAAKFSITGRRRVYVGRPEYHARDEQRRIEFKWFNTTYMRTRWERYCEVTEAVARFVQDEEQHFDESYFRSGAGARFRNVINSLLPEHLRT